MRHFVALALIKKIKFYQENFKKNCLGFMDGIVKYTIDNAFTFAYHYRIDFSKTFRFSPLFLQLYFLSLKQYLLM